MVNLETVQNQTEHDHEHYEASENLSTHLISDEGSQENTKVLI